MQLGTTKDQGLYNKPSAAVHPRELAAGTLPQYNIIPNTHAHTDIHTYIHTHTHIQKLLNFSYLTQTDCIYKNVVFCSSTASSGTTVFLEG